MKKKSTVAASLAILATCWMVCMSWNSMPPADVVINIDGSAKGAALNPDMYGMFFEDINHAADGGLYAELIQNRDFEYNRVPEDMQWVNNDRSVITDNGWRERFDRPAPLFSWSLKNTGGARATMQQTSAMPLNDNNPMSLQLDVKSLGKGAVSVSNGGYWGIAVQKGASYELSFYAHKDNQNSGAVKVSLEGTGGRVYASQTLSGISGQWKQFHASLKAAAADAQAHFVIHPLSTGKLWFDVVSLFPANTYMHRPNGLRKDLADMLAALHPSFLRFPGGCVAEGATLANRIQWKKTIGDIANRPGNWNVWRYHTTEGLGYHEFLQLCEDLKAAPMYVINVGMSCQARAGYCAPAGDVQGYLQDAFDALEYAMGPVSSKWGSLRAKNGHPQPFKIKYVEVGNENHGPYYQEAYKTFQSAIKKQYPDIITIADEQLSLSAADSAKHPGVSVEMVDDHYYKSPQFFYANQNQYDNYSRKGAPDIYIGEFAVTTPDGGAGNMRAALGEAAFMIGMERNADVVKMASYAPTFVNTNDRRWMPDMIVVKSDEAYGTPSYHTVKAFSENRPDVVLPVKVNMPAGEKDFDNLRGGFGFANKNAVVEYKDIKVMMNGRDVLNDDLKHGTGKWLIKNDNWDAKDGVLVNRYEEMKSNISVLQNSWKNYSLQFKVQKVKGDEGIHLTFLNGGGGSCNLNLAENNINLSQTVGGTNISLGKAEQKLVNGKWYSVKIDINGQSLKCFIDDKLTFNAKLQGSSLQHNLFATAGVKKSSNELIVKLVNPETKPKTCQLMFSGRVLMAPGTATVIHSLNQDDENSFARPEQIKAKTEVINLAETGNYECPPGSISILRLKIKS